MPCCHGEVSSTVTCVLLCFHQARVPVQGTSECPSIHIEVNRSNWKVSDSFLHSPVTVAGGKGRVRGERVRGEKEPMACMHMSSGLRG